ncbi:MAG TPA: SCO family protein [Pyrinomonadaceae bacterium]
MKRRQSDGSTSGNFFRPAALFALLSVLILGGCVASKGHGEVRRYDLKGKVVSVERGRGEVVVEHETIPGLMDAMTMPFALKDKDALSVVEPGDRLQATLVVADSGGFWLESPMITKAAPSGESPANESSGGPNPGDVVPDFSLVNQDDKPVRLGRYRGRALLLTFIYTRCPLADYCPLMSERFAAISRELAGEASLKDKVQLLSVSIDPAHDTPKVLRSYGAAHTQKYGGETFASWEFATGDPEEVKKLAQFFGLEYFAEKDQIIHSLRTAVIDPTGRVHKIYRGNEWQPSEVLNDVRTLFREHH